MSNDEISELRQRAQDADSRARLATDPVTKADWQSVASHYRALLAGLESPPPQPGGKRRLLKRDKPRLNRWMGRKNLG